MAALVNLNIVIRIDPGISIISHNDGSIYVMSNLMEKRELAQDRLIIYRAVRSELAFDRLGSFS